MTFIIAGFYYIAFIIFVGGVLLKIKQYWTTPAPIKIPTTPAPTTRLGVLYRMGKEIIVFESLFKSNKWIWIFGWLFHFGMFAVLFRHLRYFLDPVPVIVVMMQPLKYAAFAMLIGLSGLLFRRIFVARIRYISDPSDILMLILMLGIGISGTMMTFFGNVDIVATKSFFIGILTFNFQPFPTHPMLLIHLILVAVLMLIFPFSKLLHAPGIFFSPTRNQVDNAREKRHIAPWAAKLDKTRSV
ncbi:MAG: nitrate reductase [Gammaproteobacteria bacterium]|nr:MAG: nitrate reductase [Gammaproteobacteria bacterium]